MPTAKSKSTKPPLKLSWWNGRPNFGDALNPAVVAYAANREVVHAEKAEAEMFSVGSIMIRVRRAYAEPRDHRPAIWGTGMMGPIRLGFQDNVDFFAVRGPLTASLINIKIDTYGDPGLLLPDLCTKKITRGTDIGVIPHHGDFKDPQTKEIIEKLKAGGNVKIIDPRTEDAVQVADEIKSCRHIYSASLHGLIIADAVDVPNTWVAGRDIHVTPEFKFLDYFFSVGRTYQRPIPYEDIETHEKGIRGLETLGYGADVEACKAGLLAAFPDHLKG